MTKRYTLRWRGRATPPVAFEGDSVAECRRVAEIRKRNYGERDLEIVRNRDGYIDHLDEYGFVPPTLTPLELEQLGAAELQQRIDDDTDATARLLNYLDARKIPHSGRISGATLAAVAHAADATDRTHSRTWRKWVAGERPFPIGVRRLLVAVCWGTG